MGKIQDLYIYKDGKPHGIIDNIVTWPIDKITKEVRYLRSKGLTVALKPIHPGDFVFNETTGEKMWCKIECPGMEPGKGE